MDLHMRVTAVTQVALGNETTTDLSATDTLIPLGDSGDFSEDGGHVSISSNVYAYSVFDDGEESGTPSITLDSGLIADVDAETPVFACDETGAVVYEWKVSVTDDLDGSSAVATLSHSLIPLLPAGMPVAGGDSVTVTIDEDGDWWVTNVLGRSAGIDPAYLDGPVATGEFRDSIFETAGTAASTWADTGRLNDAVLSNRFEVPGIHIGAQGMVASGQGTPTATPPLGNLVPCWRLDGAGATDEGVVFSIQLPPAWATFDVWARGANAGAGTGAVRLIGQWNNAAGDGDDLTAGSSTGTAGVLTVDVLNIRQSVRLRSNLANDPTKPHVFRIYRTPSHASDTLGNDWALTGIYLEAKSWVEFAPELPEEGEDLSGRTFTQAHNASLGSLRVWHQAPPPVDDLDTADPESTDPAAAGFKYFPGTDYATRADFSTSTWTGSKWVIVWDNRCNYGDAWNKRPNPLAAPAVKVANKECRAVFTTRALAMAATRAQVRHVLGMTSGEIEADWVAAGGSAGDIITEATWRAAPSTYCTEEFVHSGTVYQVMVDKVVLPYVQLSDPDHEGVFLDYEAQDTRSASDSTTHITNLADDCHGESKEIFLYTNPLTGSIQTYNGLDGTNLPTILAEVDYLSVLLWSGATEGSISASWTAQIALLGTMTTALWAKVAICFELGVDPGTTIDDAEWVWDKLNEGGDDHPTKVVFWRNGASAGGAPSRLTNKKISMVCFGSETPP